MEKMGIPSQDIAAFAEPKRWLDYFPPHGVNDLKTFGASVDWRRSFVTTDQNPYRRPSGKSCPLVLILLSTSRGRH